MITGIFIGTERLELFEDEEIRIKSNVSDIQDITKIFTDTSNDFTVPASDVNNAIFKHWYESDIINGFDARQKVPATIEMHGTNYKVGKIKLKKVNLKHNQPDNYSLEFFGNLVDLKDKLGEDKINALDLSALDFAYNSNVVKSKLTFSGDILFSLLSKRRLLYDSTSSTTESDKQTNIYYDGTGGTTGLRVTDLTASIKQLKIINAIESKYSLEFSRDFLNAYDFQSQYITLSNGDVDSEAQIELTNPSSADPTAIGNALMVSGDLVAANANTDRIEISVIPQPNTPSSFVPYSLYVKNDGVTIAKVENVRNYNLLSIKTSAVAGGFKNVTFFIDSDVPITTKATINRYTFSPSGSYEYLNSFVVSSPIFIVSNRLPDIKVIDYLRGIFKMSKLVAIPQKDGTIFLDNLTNFLRKGKVYDLSKYIDYEAHTVSAGTVLNEIKYNFKKPQTVLNQQFVKNNSIGYGDLEHYIYEDPNAAVKKLVDGDSLSFDLPFEQIVYEKIRDISDSTFDSNIQYGLLQDENEEFVTIEPHIHYVERQSTNIKFINDSGSGEQLSFVNIPLHVLDNSLQLFSTTFGSEFNEFNNNLIANTLFSNYHKQYVDNVFNINKREYNFNAKEVPLDIVLNIELNDVIAINKKYYRIESLETSTSNNNIQFKLINDRNVDLTPTVRITMDSSTITMDSTEVTMDSI